MFAIYKMFNFDGFYQDCIDFILLLLHTAHDYFSSSFHCNVKREQNSLHMRNANIMMRCHKPAYSNNIKNKSIIKRNKSLIKKNTY